MEIDIKNIRTKFEFFAEYDCKVHVRKKDGTFLNGFIIKWIKDDVYLMKEDKLGNIYLFLADIKTIDQHRGSVKS